MPTFYKIDGKVCKIDGSFLATEVKSLTFQVRGSQFPNFDYNFSQNHFLFISNIPQNVIVNWGDGVSEIFEMGERFGEYGLAWAQNDVPNFTARVEFLAPTHIYQDGYSGVRNVTFTFENLTELKKYSNSDILIEGAFPVEVSAATKLEEIILRRVDGITSFPDDLSSNKELINISLQNISSEKETKIPDAFFQSDLDSFIGNGVYNLSDLVSSNLFKVNQWSNLTTLSLNDCNIIELDTTFSQIVLLQSLYLEKNLFTEFPVEIEALINLTQLRIGFDLSVNNISFIDFSNLSSITSIRFEGHFNFSEIPTKWVGLKSLNEIQTFTYLASSSLRFNEFIPYFYQLCTENGFIDNTSTEAINSGYPNQFRNISWGDSSLAVDSIVEAPPNYQQGISNGDVTTNGHRVYVLANNYNHSITYNN